MKSMVVFQLSPTLCFETFGLVSVDHMLSVLMSYTFNMLRNDDGKYEDALFSVSKPFCFHKSRDLCTFRGSTAIHNTW